MAHKKKKLAFLDMNRSEVVSLMEKLSQPAFRAKQLAEWVYQRGATDIKSMSNIPDSLADEIHIVNSRIVERYDSEDGTVKLLIEFHDGEKVECVLIPDKDRATACISMQVGCSMGCTFCASGIGGLRRNLSRGEILQQILHLRNVLIGDKPFPAKKEPRITNVVFMGTGEPLSNYNAVVAAIKSIIDLEKFAISARNVTVSTLGIPRMIKKLADEKIPITLALSLHAPDNVLRSQLMPATRKWPIEKVMAAAEYFFTARKREITIEYMLIENVNDSNKHLNALGKIARRIRCNLNIIRYNPVDEFKYRSPSSTQVRTFAERLRQRGINVNVRRRRGKDISAACGQLKNLVENKNKKDSPSPKKEKKSSRMNSKSSSRPAGRRKTKT